MSKSWEQILGGYATDTLTEEEKQQLFEAALYDQTLFDTLADEEALKALLADPKSRQRILASLQATENPQKMAASHGSRLNWIRQPSSLAWAGSIAALGLVLIFGWQFEKEWGPVFKQVQEEELARSKKKEEVAFRSKPSDGAAENLRVQKPQPQTKSAQDPLASQPAPPRTVEQPVIAKASKDTERKKVASPQPSPQRAVRQDIKKELRKPVTPTPESAQVQNVPEETQSMVSSVGKRRVGEEDFQPSSQAAPFADQLRKEDARSSASEKEFFYRKEGKHADTAAEDRGGMRAQELLEGTLSGEEDMLEQRAPVLKGAQEAHLGAAVKSKRSIRYHFVRRVQQEDHDQTIDRERTSSNWQDVQLTIESNTPGHLYVLTSLDQGKWRFLNPETSDLTKSSDGAIMVRLGQSVRFLLSQLPDRRERQVASSIVVLLSSTPLSDLSTWLTVEKGHQPSVDTLDGGRPQEYIVIERSLNPNQPFRVEIPLPQ